MKVFQFIKLILILTFFLGSIPGFSQLTIPLEKYSYRIMELKDTGAGGATCFFIRNQNELYLITAKHVVSGCIDIKTKVRTYADIMYVFTNGVKIEPITIDTKNTFKILPCNGIDVYILKVNSNIITEHINSVEKFFQPPFAKWRACEINGYPLHNYTAAQIFNVLTPPLKISIPENTFQFQGFVDSTGKKDLSIGSIECNNNSIKSDSLGGYSGSPVFLQNIDGNMWRLIGLFSGSKQTGKESTSLSYVPFEAIMIELQKLFN